HDNFFDLGGDSIRATQLVARVRAALSVDLAVGACFDAPTLAGLATRVQAALAAMPARTAAPVRAASRTGAIPLSFPQRRLWFLDRLDPGSATYNVPVAISLEGPLDGRALARALDDVVRRH